MASTPQYVARYPPPVITPPIQSPILTPHPPFMYPQPSLPYMGPPGPPLRHPGMVPPHLRQPPQMFMPVRSANTFAPPMTTVTSKKPVQPQRRQLIPVPKQGNQPIPPAPKPASVSDLPRRVLFVGDSLIHQLGNDFVGQNQNLNLHQREFEIHFVGKLGGRVSDLEPPALNHSMNEIQPHHVMIQCGGDDLDSPNFKQVLMCLPTQLVSIAQRLVDGFGVTSVGIMQIVPRETTKHMHFEDYNQAAYQANNSIKALCKNKDNIFYWNHKGLKNMDVTSIGDNGVRLTESGMVKYFRSVRGVTLFVSRGGKKENLQ